MRHAKIAIAFALVLLAGASAGYWFANRHVNGQSPNGTEGPNGRKVLYWHDPMVPGQRFDKPGKSPFMDMQLVPVYADEEPGGAAVRVNPSVVQNLGIRMGKVEKAVLTPSLTAVGSVAFDERRVRVVQARAEGYVQRLLIKAPLETVRRGQPLAELVAPQWLSAQEEYLALLDASSELGTAIRDAARTRLHVLGVPESTIRDLEQSRATRASTMLVAPIDGVVSELAVREGAAVATGAPLFRISGLETVWVIAQVPEAQIGLIPRGSTVAVRATGWRGADFSGRVLAILPEVDAQSRTLFVRIEVDNRDRKLAPGMFVSLDLKAPAAEPQLAVPTEAVIMTGERNVVIVAREEGGFDPVSVKTGAEADGKTAILSGLTEGQSIVLSGQFLIDSEASLKSTASRLSSSDAAPATATTGAAAAHPSAHLAQGTITALADDTITIAHEAVPSLNWPAMTMPFQWKNGANAGGLKVGDRVSFSFVEGEPGSYRLEAITKLEERRP